jgi:hypothetical protein
MLVMFGALWCRPGHGSMAVLGQRGGGGAYSVIYQRKEKGEGTGPVVPKGQVGQLRLRK